MSIPNTLSFLTQDAKGLAAEALARRAETQELRSQLSQTLDLVDTLRAQIALGNTSNSNSAKPHKPLSGSDTETPRAHAPNPYHQGDYSPTRTGSRSSTHNMKRSPIPPPTHTQYTPPRHTASPSTRYQTYLLPEHTDPADYRYTTHTPQRTTTYANSSLATSSSFRTPGNSGVGTSYTQSDIQKIRNETNALALTRTQLSTIGRSRSMGTRTFTASHAPRAPAELSLTQHKFTGSRSDEYYNTYPSQRPIDLEEATTTQSQRHMAYQTLMASASTKYEEGRDIIDRLTRLKESQIASTYHSNTPITASPICLNSSYILDRVARANDIDSYDLLNTNKWEIGSVWVQLHPSNKQ